MTPALGSRSRTGFFVLAALWTLLSIPKVVGAQTLSIADAAVFEGDTGTTFAVFDVTLQGITPLIVEVSFATEDGTATVADRDYAAKSGVLSFRGAGTQQIMVEVFGDDQVEDDEVFSVTLSNVVNATIADGDGQGTIFNDDVAVISLAIGNATVSEGDAGTVQATFDVTLSNPAATQLMVSYATRDGSAIAGSDYLPATDTLLFAPGETQKTIDVTVFGDVVAEADETFFVDTSAPGLPAVSGRCTIFNDDVAVSLAIGDANVIEGDAGTVQATFDVTLSSPAATQLTVSYATRDGSAVAGADYAAASGTLNFAFGEVLQTVTVEVLGDGEVESDETFFVDLSNAIGAVIADGEGVGTIGDDDTPSQPGLEIGNATVIEGDEGTVQAEFDVTLTPATNEAVTVDFATRDGTAIAGDDYTATAGGLTFAPGETTHTVAVEVLGDRVVEGDETFFVDLSNADGAAIADGEGRGSITDDDMMSFSIGDATVGEGESKPAAFEVTLSSPASQALTVDFATADGTATGNVDYRIVSDTLTFPAGVTVKTIPVEVFDDVAVEADETFFVDLANPSGGAAIADGRGLGTIVDDDEVVPSPSRIRFARVPTAMEGAGTVVVTVERVGGADEVARVTVRSAAGTASAGEDFTAAERVLEWAAGELGGRAFEIEILDDVLEEADETVAVTLSDPSGAVLEGGARRELTILDDDTPMALEPVGDSEITAAAGTEVELRVRAARDDGDSVAGATVVWSVDGEAELVDGELTSTGGDGVTAQRLGLGNRPGEILVFARIQGLEAGVTFRITVEGNLGDRVDRGQDPGAGEVADVLDEACAAAGELDGLCDYIYSLDGPDQDKLLDELTPTEVSALGTVALESGRNQLRNLAARMAELRRGTRNQGLSQLAVSLRGQSLDVGGLIAAFRGRAPAAIPTAAASRVPEAGEPEYWLAASRDRDTGSFSSFRFAEDTGSDGDDSIGGLGEDVSRLGFFVNGQVSFGDRPTVAGESGFDFETTGLTAGVDYLVSDRFFFGAAAGYLDTGTDFVGAGGELDAEGISLSLYGSWYLAHFYVDGVLGYGVQDYDTVRNVDLPRPFAGRDRFVAAARPEGDQLSWSLGAGYDTDRGAWSLGGFGRLSGVEADIDAYAESGAGVFDLAFASQTARSLLAEVGVEITYAASKSWGVLLPTLRLAALHEFEDDLRLIRARFAQDRTATDFVVPTAAPDRDFFNLAAGVTATLPRGRTLFLLYDTDLGRDDLDVATITFGLRLEL